MPGGNDGVHVGKAGARQPHGGGAAVLLVVGVENEEKVNCAHHVIIQP